MSERFSDYHAAYHDAVETARLCRHDVTIRRVREYGRDGFNVSLACRNDSDYALAEIVTPTDPWTENVKPGSRRVDG